MPKKKIQTSPPKKMGRPTTYKTEYCELLIEHMGKGFSFESFAGIVGTHKEVIYGWAERNVDFSDAKKMGLEVCRVFWEDMGIKGTRGTLRYFQAGSWYANMRNRFAWKDRSEVDHKSSDGTFNNKQSIININLPVKNSIPEKIEPPKKPESIDN